MKPPGLSSGKRLTKPLLFGTLVVGLAAAFFNRSDLSCVRHVARSITPRSTRRLRAEHLLKSECLGRHSFLTDVDELRAQERARNLLRRAEVMERRQRQIEELAEKKKGGSS